VIGNFLDKYEVLQKVGEGGMATVYRGRHATLDRPVAIKVLHPHLTASTRNRKRFAREARAIEHLRHENILEIFDYSGLDCEDCYIVTEFVEGETLTSVLDRVGRLPSEVVALIGLELCDALEYAHQSGILHRDLKPDNVMIRRDGHVKLMDFGIARFLDESQVTMTGALVGSPAFMSPEQAKEIELDPRSDLFSLGTLLFLLVTGHLPFSGTNTSIILKNIIEGTRPGPVDLCPAMSAALADVIDRLLQTDREDRYRNAHEVRDALTAVLIESDVAGQARFTVGRYLEDPSGFTEALEAHLVGALALRGQEYMASGNHLGALRLYNRVLSVDDDNTDVMALIDSLHGEETRRKRRVVGARTAIGAVLALLGVGAAAAAFALWPTPRTVAPTPDSAPVGAAPVPSPPGPAPVGVAPEPTPAAAPVDRRLTVAVPPTRLEPPTRLQVELPAPEPEPTPPPSPSFGSVYVNTGQFPAEIFEDDVRLGASRQREPVRLSAGVHRLTLRSPVTRDHSVEVAVSSGETVRVAVELMPRPAVVFVPPDYPDSCRVNRNGEPLGDLASISRSVVLERPDRANVVVLDCGDRGVFQETFEHPRTLNLSFPTP
jgi:tRNA A-37 threonylcarbamoyl transferase component Bud32